MRTFDPSRPQRTILLAVAAIAVAVTVAVLVSRSPASAQEPGTTVLTLTELDKGSTFSHIRNTKTKVRRANLRGDLDVFTNPLADAAGNVVGKLNVACITTKGSSNYLQSTGSCNGTMALSGGTLTLQTLITFGDSNSSGAVTGGTGTYANARGTFVSAHGRDGSVDTINLVG